MTSNFVARPRDESLIYRFDTGETEAGPGGRREAKVVDLTIYYRKGETTRGRGIYVAIYPKTVGPGFESMTITMFAPGEIGRPLYVVPLLRKSYKHMARVAEILSPVAGDIARAYAAGDKAGAFYRLRSALGMLTDAEIAEGLKRESSNDPAVLAVVAKLAALPATEEEAERLRNMDPDDVDALSDEEMSARIDAELDGADEETLACERLAAAEARQAAAAAECGGCANGEHCNACDCCGDDSEDPTSAEWTPAKAKAQSDALKAIGAPVAK